MIHGELSFGKLTATMMATTWSNLLLPPLRLTQFARLGSLAFDLLGRHPTLIWHKLSLALHRRNDQPRLATCPKPRPLLPKQQRKRQHQPHEVHGMKPSQMQERLEAAYPGAQIQVTDLTGTEDHYQVVVVHPVFKGLSRIEQHQHVMKVFADELRTGEVHALTIKTATPQN